MPGFTRDGVWAHALSGLCLPTMDYERGQVADIITYVKFLVNRFSDYRVLTPQNCHFPLTCCVALRTMYALPCDTVISKERQNTCTILVTIGLLSVNLVVYGVLCFAYSNAVHVHPYA